MSRPCRIAVEAPKAEPVPEHREGELLLEGSFSEYDRWLGSIKAQNTALALVRPWTRVAARVIRVHFSSRTRSAYGNMDDVLRDCTANPVAEAYHPADSYVGEIFCRTYPKQRNWDEIILLGELWHNQGRRVQAGVFDGGSSSSEYENFHPIITRSGWGGMQMRFMKRARKSLPSHYLMEAYYYDYLKGREMWALFYRII